MKRRWIYLLTIAAALLEIFLALPSCAAPQEQETTEDAERPKLERPRAKQDWWKADFASERSANLYENSASDPLALLKALPADQASIWTSPFRMRSMDADWLVPLGIASSATLATDQEFSRHLSNSPTRLHDSMLASQYGLAALGGIGGGMYLWGHLTHNDHKKETALLVGDAVLQSFMVARSLNSVLGRQDPHQNSYRGNFFDGGHSFPSQSAAAAWSLASVISHEYPGPLTKLLVYGLATAVTASSVSSKQHFQSDVLIGSAMGSVIGQQIYRRHYNPTLGGEGWESYREAHDPELGDKKPHPGSPYVPLDSWVYSAIERLASRGYIDTAFLGMRPWTRLECAALAEKAGEKIDQRQADAQELAGVQTLLVLEFHDDLEALSGANDRSARVESVYSGATQISGTPLNDSYHFGQTIINNFGRPYGQGFNAVEGFSSYGTSNRFAYFVRGEYQRAPAGPGYPDSVRELISTKLDGTPLAPGGPIPAVNDFRLLDAYVAANVANWDFSFGNQSLWWGPGEGGALLFSDNAVPILMFRANNVAPLHLPWIFGYLGPMKLDAFFGKLTGSNQVPARPLLHGEKISFKPTSNLELGFSRTVEMGGVGRALTFGHLWRSYFSVTSSVDETPDTDPGKRTGGFDFSYRLPFLRNWVTLYSDSLSDDDPSPVDAPRRAAVNPGIYVTHFPKFSRLDLRVEGVSTNTPSSSDGGHFVYFDHRFRNLYTNDKNLIGSWIGREGEGLQAWSTYHFSARDSVQVGYRHAKVSPAFIPQGETLNNEFIKTDWWFGTNLEFSGFLQHETWVAPVLAAQPQTNWTSSVMLSYWPHRSILRANGSSDTDLRSQASEVEK